ncbi:hypothetical protein QAD02_008951 [Eretmocerus hayati]|uniref:Uncharacterized protein n=1 Tax=Eretmocerus hayati TaxID=131215 RepID=A0ACC2N8B0_9HYME|nr:hypothetical protein QAD02_008951 [Eretmocerus hayati]
MTKFTFSVFDSSVKYPHGIIYGQTRHLGSFDQCYRIRTEVRNKTGGLEEIRGKYCLVDYKYQQKDAPKTIPSELKLDFDLNDSVWQAIKDNGDLRRIQRHVLQMALCVPATCDVVDIQRSLQETFDEFAENNDLVIEVKADEKNCQTSTEQRRISAGGIIYCLMLSTIVIFLIMGTVYETSLKKSNEKQEKSVNQLLLCFSIRRNLQKLLEVDYKHPGLDTIHVFRFFSMCLVIFGHRGLQFYLNPVVNGYDLEKTFDEPLHILLHNGPILVDGFLAVGGLLTCYGLLHRLDKMKHINFFTAILSRFWRLTPVYFFIVLFHAYILPHVGSGPLWSSIIDQQADNCASTWWAHLLYLNTYRTMDRLCIFQSWYLSVDFHCYVLSIFLIHEFWKRPRWIGYSLLTLVTFISVLIPFVITFKNRLQPLFLGFPRTLTSLSMDTYFRDYYVKTHLRASAYFIGVLVGAVLYDYRNSTWKISRRYSKVLFVLLLCSLCTGTQALAYSYLNPYSNHSRIKMALYAGLHRSLFALGVCSVVILISMSEGLDSHREFLTPAWVQPLSRLTYSTFLSHNIVQTYQAATTRSAQTFSMHSLLWNLVPDIISSFLIAFVIVITIELPFKRLHEHFFSKKEHYERTSIEK